MPIYDTLEVIMAPTSPQEAGKEILYALLLIGCACVGWCASSAMLTLLGWNAQQEASAKGKEGSDAFRNEVAAFVQSSSIQGASAHFGLSIAEIQNLLDAAGHAQNEHAESKIMRAVMAVIASLNYTMESFVESFHKACISTVVEDNDEEDQCAEPTEVFSTAPSSHAGIMLLEHYGVFGTQSGMWTGPIQEHEQEPVWVEEILEVDGVTYVLSEVDEDETQNDQECPEEEQDALNENVEDVIEIVEPITHQTAAFLEEKLGELIQEEAEYFCCEKEAHDFAIEDPAEACGDPYGLGLPAAGLPADPLDSPLLHFDTDSRAWMCQSTHSW